MAAIATTPAKTEVEAAAANFPLPPSCRHQRHHCKTNKSRVKFQWGRKDNLSRRSSRKFSEDTNDSNNNGKESSSDNGRSCIWALNSNLNPAQSNKNSHGTISLRTKSGWRTCKGYFYEISRLGIGVRSTMPPGGSSRIRIDLDFFEKLSFLGTLGDF